MLSAIIRYGYVKYRDFNDVYIELKQLRDSQSSRESLIICVIIKITIIIILSLNFFFWELTVAAKNEQEKKKKKKIVLFHFNNQHSYSALDTV